MAVSPEWNATLLQSLHHFKAHRIPFNCRLKNNPTSFMGKLTLGLESPHQVFSDHVGMVG
jgi:hypothetical protein